MYSLKPINENFQIKLPDCMYKVKPIHNWQINSFDGISAANSSSAAAETTTTTCNFTELNRKILNLINSSIKGDDSMQNLEIRQRKLIEQLNNFKNQLEKIRKKLNITMATRTTRSTTATTVPKIAAMKNKQQHQISNVKNQLAAAHNFEKTTPIDNIVVNVHPKFIPFGLLGLKSLWKGLCNLKVECYSHSTLGELNNAAVNFQKLITSNNGNIVDVPEISLTLIWKNCEHTEMICSKTMYKPIYGEVNVLRFLARIGPKEFQYDFQPIANHTDAILDICYQLLRCSSVSTCQELLKNLSNRLQNNKFFGGNQLSIADVALSSSIKRCPQISNKVLPDNLKIWQTNIKNVIQI